MTYTSEKEILEVIAKFKNGTIPREDWGHPEHLILAYHYLTNNDFETAVIKMRNGIFNLLKAFEIDLTKNMPYHETLTIFWMKTVSEFIEVRREKPIATNINEMIENFDKNYPLRYYDKDVLFSEKARESFVEPNLIKLTE